MNSKNAISTIKKQTISASIIGLFLILSFWKVNNVGLFYDELLHAVSAQKLIANSPYWSEIPAVVNKTIMGHTFPLMIHYYVGPFKSYLQTIPLWLFHNTDIAIRIFSIICGAITLLLTYIFCNKNFGKKAAIITALLLASDPSYILSSRYDWGPIAVQNILKLTALIALFNTFNSNAKKINHYIFAISTALLLWEKLNAIWIIIPFWSIYVYKNFVQINKMFLVKIVLVTTITLVPYAIYVIKKPFFYYESVKSFREFETYRQISNRTENLDVLLKNYSSSLSDKVNTFNATLNGSAIPNHILIQPLTGSVGTIITLIALLAFAYYRFSKIIKDKKIQLETIDYIFLLIISSILATMLTAHANGPHHILLLWPLHIILIGYLLNACFNTYSKQVIALIIVITLNNILLLKNFTVATTSDENLRTYWKKQPAYVLKDHIQKTHHRYRSLDWGITLPIAFLSNGSIDIADIQPFYNANCKKIETLFEEGTIFIVFNNDNIVFPEYYDKCKYIFDTAAVEDLSIYRLYSRK